MKFIETPLPGAYLIEVERVADDRGFFARTWCQHELQQHKLNTQLVQCSISFNKQRGTLRGLHYQDRPHEETKLVRCTSGSIFDVLVDLRRESPSYGKWHSAVLNAENRKAFYIPPGIAHGFQTLEDNSEVLYQISEFYQPDSARGVRWDDAAFAIPWPEPVRTISERDRSYPDFKR